MHTDRWTNAAILTLATLIGMVAFAYPLLSPATELGVAALAHSRDAPLVTLVLTLLCVTIVVANLTSGQMSARTIAVLGVLTAVNAVLRALPGPGGFSAIFFLLGLCGYVYGSTFGYLMGVLSLLVSALIGGGVGPWLPYQMFTAGWMGLSSGWLPHLAQQMARWTPSTAAYLAQQTARWTPSTAAYLARSRRAELALLAAWTGAWGFVFGAVMNLWFWPYISSVQAAPSQSWQAGLSLMEGLRRYALFYVATSAWWDAWRALGNAGLVLFLGAPLLRVLRRFQHVLGFEIEEADRA